MQQYWRTVGFSGEVADLEIRARIALRLVEHFGSVAGKRGPEAAATGKGDPGIELQTPEELVERSFRIADLFVDTAETRGEIRTVDLLAEKKAQDDLDEQRFDEMTQRRTARRSAPDKAGA